MSNDQRILLSLVGLALSVTAFAGSLLQPSWFSLVLLAIVCSNGAIVADNYKRRAD